MGFTRAPGSILYFYLFIWGFRSRSTLYRSYHNGKELPAFPLEAMTGIEPGVRGGRRDCYHSATVGPTANLKRGR